MAQVVQAKCPHCKNTLRIPADWVYKSMRCKFCKKVFQAKQKPAEGITATPPAQARSAHVTATPPTSARPAGHDPFAFDEGDEPVAAPVRPRKKRSKALLAVALFGVLIVAGLGVAGALYKKLGGQQTVADVQGDGGAGDAGEGGSGNSATTTSTKKGTGSQGKKAVARGGGKFPRRALLISVNNYLMLNPLNYGQSAERDAKFPGSSTGALRERLMVAPMNMDADQVIELTDAGKGAHSPQKAVVETTIKEFLAGCREQDRILLLFAGHACEIEKDCYLIPIEGTRDEPEKLIPLKWVLAELGKCKAQEKILVLDVFRYAPARGFELPSAGEGDRGEMGEVFDQALQSPLPGVQIWSACTKGQASIESERGSAFIQALLNALQDRTVTSGIGKESDPLPLEFLVTQTNKRLKELVARVKQEQTARLTGKASGSEAAYDPDEPMPARLAIKPPPPPPGGAASAQTVDKLLEDIKELPPVRRTQAASTEQLKASNLPPMPAKVLDQFKAEGYKSIADLHGQFKKNPEEFAKRYPLRAGYFEALEALKECNNVQFIESLNGPSPLDQKVKNAFLKQQEEPARLIFKLEQVLGQLKTVEEERDKETSKRWQANFDYARTRVEARLVYLMEYNYLVAGIRADRLPDLENGQTGWRVGTSKKVKINEVKAKQLVKDIQKHWKKIEDQYPDTPWAVLAKRENLISLGLEWRPKSD